MIGITLLGSTGSIGQSTLDVVRRYPDRFRLHALVAGRNLSPLASQVAEFRPDVVAIADPADVPVLEDLIRSALAPGDRVPQLGSGAGSYIEAATSADASFVMSAIVGVAGMEATYEAVRAGKRIGLANKESLVSGGAFLMEAVRASGVDLIPVDSEHNGAHQCLRAGRREEVTKLILTASGGPFRNFTRQEMLSVTPAQALNHPTWKMGPRITIDSATLMNKGFEVIEACWLFDFAPSEVEVVVHPQSTVHAMVEYNDGSVLAQVSATDMRMPIQYALTWPDRAPAPVPRLDWRQSRSWDFHSPDFERFPLLRLAYEAMREGGTATCTLNAADEVAVESFLEERIPFLGIAEVVEETLARMPARRAASMQELLEVDRQSRETAANVVRERSGVGAARPGMRA